MQISGPAAEAYLFRNGPATIVALQRDPPKNPASPGADQMISLDFPHPVFAYELRARRRFGPAQRFTLPISPLQPLLLAVAEQEIVPPSIEAPPSARLGETVELRMRAASLDGAGEPVLHLDVIDPTGQTVPHYSGNLVLPRRARGLDAAHCPQRPRGTLDDPGDRSAERSGDGDGPRGDRRAQSASGYAAMSCFCNRHRR